MKLPAAILASVCLFLACTTIDNTHRYPQMVADADPIPVGSTEAQFERLLSTRLIQHPVNVIFYPRLNAVALEFRHEFITYRQFWDQDARRQFTAALAAYEADYADRKLVNRYGKTRAVYGRLEGRLEWESFSFSQTYIAFPQVELGYRFREGAPFFTPLMRSAVEYRETGGDSNLTESQQFNIYFTRAQAAELTALFDQTYLMGLLSGVGRPSSGSVTRDAYLEDTQTEDE